MRTSQAQEPSDPRLGPKLGCFSAFIQLAGPIEIGARRLRHERLVTETRPRHERACRNPALFIEPQREWPFLRDRITALKVDRDRVHGALARARSDLRPAVGVSPIVAERFGRAMPEQSARPPCPRRRRRQHIHYAGRRSMKRMNCPSPICLPS